MNNRHRDTLEAIFTHPTPNNIRWDDAVSLFKALGATIARLREGSRVAILTATRTGIYHRPHLGSTIGRATVRDMMRQLREEGIGPGK
jgi:hypothetical protein